ncbi:hypothetical protein ThidrDRAFT_1170 [Thiorhodococcus drewsii AZ1]|uniref:Uncharacterized protein n=1 Tax=Thiorhodococcus drewsii AZ1 TaxID=765913 RepID=G2DYQ8_9GAMM|nr:hypothetical protein [Thiorhodococcus drewsii]EGV32685.1 hypothetical protein ThidrDRAFT_1170 [Thiorhodococcus drewsii AZ1]
MAEIHAAPQSMFEHHGGSSILLALLLSAAVTVAGLVWMQRQLDMTLAVRPPIVVLDLTGAARESDPARLKTLLDDYRTTAERLAGQGLLVLDRQAVLAAPAGLILTEREVRHATD